MKMKYFLALLLGIFLSVFGYSLAQNCSTTCISSPQDASESCNVTSGECLYGCQLGYTGYNCTDVCPENCASPDDESSNYCNGTTMECNSGCNVGYGGLDCTIICPENCKLPSSNGSETCNSTSGECLLGCNIGYAGLNCTVACPKNCNLPSSNDSETCDSTSGECLLGCNIGYAGLNCTEACPENCKLPSSNGSETCNSTSGECLLGCNIGYAGSNCDVECPENCGVVPLQNDSADVCHPDSGNCKFGCKYGFAGQNCSSKCPINCARPSVDFVDTCNETTLECSSGCEDGFMGSNCTQECPVNCRSPDKKCDAFSGKCSDGCDDGYAGDTCSYDCPENCFPSASNLTDMCDVISGECLSGCIHGFTGPNCTVPCPQNCGITSDPNIDACDAETGRCSAGCLYGFTGENCTISCPENCAIFTEGGLQITCDPTTLECMNGCNVTYTGAYCNESCPRNCDRCQNTDECSICKNGYYKAPNIQCIDCPWQCKPPPGKNFTRTCSPETGHCEFGCERKYYGQRCTRRCQSTCKDEVCERTGGKCSLGCTSTGFTGLTCTELCNDGCYRSVCEQSGKCIDGCNPKYWGDSCDELCNDNCRPGPTDETNICDISNGTCSYGCNDDLYWGHQCSTRCSEFCYGDVCDQITGNCTLGCSSDEVYGIGCDKTCSSNCVNGTCFRDDGICKTGCKVGWYGGQCDKECVSNCNGDICDREDGTCIDGCKTGWFGLYCAERCGLNCLNKTCYIDTGNCTFGCVYGSEGPKCDQAVTPGPPSTSEPIDSLWIYVGLGVAGLIVISLIVIIILVARRRKIIIERRRRTTMYENFPDDAKEQVKRREPKKKKGPVARITQMLVENPLALLMRGNKGQSTSDDIGAYTKIAVDDLLEIVIQAEESGGNEEFEKLKTGLTKPHEESRKLENLAHNFFSGIFPYDENRVIIGRGKRREDIGDHHSILKHKPKTDRNGQSSLSVHFKSFGRTNTDSDLKKNENSPEDDNSNVIAGSSHESTGNQSPDNGDAAVLFTKAKSGDESDGEIKISPSIQSADSLKQAEKRDYINASYIKAHDGKVGYIAAQAPAKSTVNDFWLMVWEQQCTMIVMLSTIDDEENSASEKYWPDTGSSATYGSTNVTCVSCDVHVIYTVRQMKIQNETEDEEMNLLHYQFTDWPKRGCPASAISFIEFHQNYKSLRGSNTTGDPVVVHCTAGVGRTGVFIGLDYLVDEGTETGYVNVYKCVEQLREQRVDMVRDSDQYDFLYKTLAQSFALECQLVNRSSLQDMLTRLRKVDIEQGGKQKIEYLFKNLRDSLTLDTSEIASLDVVQEGRRKDRPTSDVPDILYRPNLPNGAYINAVVLDSFKCRETMIATQMPTPDTLSDFCQLLLHRKCDTIVMLNNLDPNDKTLGYYWPKHKKHMTVGNVKITNVEEDKKSDIDYITRTLKLEVKQSSKDSEVRDFTMIEYKGWKIVKNVPNAKNLLKLVLLCRKYVKNSSDKRLLVHCMNGSEQSGLFCALYNIIDRLDTENELSVTCIVRTVLARLPAAIPTSDQLEMCFSLACTYIAESAISHEQ